MAIVEPIQIVRVRDIIDAINTAIRTRNMKKAEAVEEAISEVDWLGVMLVDDAEVKEIFRQGLLAIVNNEASSRRHVETLEKEQLSVTIQGGGRRVRTVDVEIRFWDEVRYETKESNVLVIKMTREDIAYAKNRLVRHAEGLTRRADWLEEVDKQLVKYGAKKVEDLPADILHVLYEKFPRREDS